MNKGKPIPGARFIAQALADLRPMGAIDFAPDEDAGGEVPVSGDSIADIISKGMVLSMTDLARQLESMGYLSSEERSEMTLKLNGMSEAWKMDIIDACPWSEDRHVNDEVADLVSGMPVDE